MNEIVKTIIEETFKSKRQQRYFYAKANDKSLPKKKRSQWKKWAKEFSDKTNFSKLPETAEQEKEIDEIVDETGNIKRSNIPINLMTKYTGTSDTSDQNVTKGYRSMGRNSFGFGGAVAGANTIKYWAESDMSKALGYKETLGVDADYEDAEEHFEDELELDPEETEDRLENMGYDPKYPEGKLRLIENPMKFIEEYIESLLSKKTQQGDVLEKGEFDDGDIEEKEINPIIKRQIEALKQTLQNNKIPPSRLMKYLRDNE